MLNKKILITRSRGQVSDLAGKLEALGAQVIEFPTIEIVPPDSFADLDEAIKNSGQYDWLLFTSVNGVDFFWDRLKKAGKEVSDLSHLKIAAIGPTTSKRIEKYGLSVDLLPDEFRAEGLVEALKEAGIAKKKVLLPRAKKAREVLLEDLKKLQCDLDVVDAYQTVLPKVDPQKVKEIFEGEKPDWITFLSSSTVENFVTIVRKENLLNYLKGIKVACIGPITKATAEKLGMKVSVMPQEYTINSLVQSILEDAIK